MDTSARCPPPRAGGMPIATRAPRHHQPWLPREDRALRASAGVVPVGEVAARLGRSRPAVLARARALGLHWYRPSPGRPHPGHTLGDVARLLGVSACTARRWVAAGWLLAARREVRLGRHTLWLVGADDLERFLRECRPVYEPGRIRDPAWRAFVAALPPERDPWLTPCEAARLLRLTAHGIRRRIATGQLAARRWGGRYYLRRSTLAQQAGSCAGGRSPTRDPDATHAARCRSLPSATSPTA